MTNEQEKRGGSSRRGHPDPVPSSGIKGRSGILSLEQKHKVHLDSLQL